MMLNQAAVAFNRFVTVCRHTNSSVRVKVKSMIVQQQPKKKRYQLMHTHDLLVAFNSYVEHGRNSSNLVDPDGGFVATLHGHMGQPRV